MLAAGLVEPAPPALMMPLVTPPLAPSAGEGMEMILEGFLLHHGTPRHLSLPDRGRRVLAGDYCYAQGLVRVAAGGDLYVIEALADLIALGASLVARGQRDALPALWRATAAAIAAEAGTPAGEDRRRRFTLARRALRSDADGGPVGAIAAELPPAPALEEALAA